MNDILYMRSLQCYFAQPVSVEPLFDTWPSEATTELPECSSQLHKI